MSADPCQSWRSFDFLERDTLPMVFFFSTHLSVFMKNRMSDNQTLHQNQAVRGEFKSQEECIFILQCWSCYIHIFVVLFG